MTTGKHSGLALPAAPVGSGTTSLFTFDDDSLEAMLGMAPGGAAGQQHDPPATDDADGSPRSDPSSAGPEVPLQKLPAADGFVIQYTEKEKRQRKYECKHCRKRFLRPSSLLSHVYTHTGERPFGCEFPGCSRRFAVQSNLRRHHKVHAKRQHAPGASHIRGVPFAWSLLPGDAPGPSPPVLPGYPLLAAGHMPPLLGRSAGPLPLSAFAPSSQFRSTYLGVPAADGGVLASPTPLSHAIVGSAIGSAVSHVVGGLPLLPRFAPGSDPLSPMGPTPVPLDIFASTYGSVSSNGSSPGLGNSLCLTDTVLDGSFGSGSSTGSAALSRLGSQFTDSQVEAILASANASYSGDSDSGSDSTAASGSGQISLLGEPLLPPVIATPAILTNTSTTTKAMNGGIDTRHGAPSNAAALLDTLYAGCTSTADNPMWQLLQAARTGH
ncbi:hypothetical protein H4R19_002237 [Coemansia spiralis]|nr:hypothetical protein H4R19_002237 [Coemansia spiralis]